MEMAIFANVTVPTTGPFVTVTLFNVANEPIDTKVVHQDTLPALADELPLNYDFED